MNILYCGDKNVVPGLFLSTLSLLKWSKEPLCIYVLTADCEAGKNSCEAISEKDISALNKLVKSHNSKSFAKRFDVSKLLKKDLPKKNLKTFFTPCCMLRLYADLIPKMPDKMLYLDTDVMASADFQELYDTELDDFEFAGVLDNYGSHLFHRESLFARDYINSGVLLLNMPRIKKTKLFKKSREMCKSKKMFMPDQSALNKLALKKKFLPRKFNEQKSMQTDTVFRHFTTTIRILPYPHPQTIKPWNVQELHRTLKCHEFDDILEQYEELKVR